MSEQDAGFRVEELFAQGKVSMMLTTYYGLNALRQSGLAYNIAPIPKIAAAPATLVIGIGLAVNRHSPRAAEAKLLVDFLTGPHAQAIIRRDTLSLPALRTASEEDGVGASSRPSRFNMYREIIPTFRFGDELGLREREWSWFLPETLSYLSGLATEAAYCERVEAAGMNLYGGVAHEG